MDINSALTGGGTTGLIGVVTYVAKQWRDAARDRHNGIVTERSASVADADTANAVILRTVKALGDENRRLQTKVNHLERESTEKDEKIADLYQRLGDAQKQILSIADELTQLRTSR